MKFKNYIQAIKNCGLYPLVPNKNTIYVRNIDNKSIISLSLKHPNIVRFYGKIPNEKLAFKSLQMAQTPIKKRGYDEYFNSRPSTTNSRFAMLGNKIAGLQATIKKLSDKLNQVSEEDKE